MSSYFDDDQDEELAMRGGAPDEEDDDGVAADGGAGGDEDLGGEEEVGGEEDEDLGGDDDEGDLGDEDDEDLGDEDEEDLGGEDDDLGDEDEGDDMGGDEDESYRGGATGNGTGSRRRGPATSRGAAAATQARRGDQGRAAAVRSALLDDDLSGDEDDDDLAGDEYLQKFESDMQHDYVLQFHPESVVHNYDEVLALCSVVRDKNGVVVDPLHRTVPFLTKYERARILGQRTKQLDSGAQPLVKVPEHILDNRLIAELELKERKMPFILRRPLPDGGSEYWRVQDLEDVSF